MQDIDDYDRRAGRTRYFSPSEFDPVRHGFDNDLTPDELRAYQAQFDAEIAQHLGDQHQTAPRESAWTLWALPLLMIAGVIFYALLWAWIVS